MNGIPISFQLQRKQFAGYLTEVSGVGGEHSNWYLMGNDKRYYGRLRLVIQDPVYIENPMQEEKPEKETWYFDENDGSKGYSHLIEYFRDVVTAWYQ